MVGVPIAKALDLDLSDRRNRAKVAELLRIWIKNGMFEVYQAADDERKLRKFVRVGAPA